MKMFETKFIPVSELEAAKAAITRKIERAMRIAINDGDTDGAEFLMKNIMECLTVSTRTGENLPVSDPC